MIAATGASGARPSEGARIALRLRPGGEASRAPPSRLRP